MGVPIKILHRLEAIKSDGMDHLAGVGLALGPRQRVLLWWNAALGVQVAEYAAGHVRIGDPRRGRLEIP